MLGSAFLFTGEGLNGDASPVVFNYPDGSIIFATTGSGSVSRSIVASETVYWQYTLDSGTGTVSISTGTDATSILFTKSAAGDVTWTVTAEVAGGGTQLASFTVNLVVGTPP